MLTLYHHPFSGASRFVRLMTAEHDVKVTLEIERVWERRTEFLAINPAGTVPVAIENDAQPLVGASVIMEYFDETRGYALGERRLMPDEANGRAEMRRLVEWFGRKFHDEVTH